MATKHFVVVGAGLGGLAIALRLAHRGHRVTVLEKTDQVGGRNREIRVGESWFDAGPTLMMMLDPFFKLFKDVGENLHDWLEISLCDPSYRVFWADGLRLDGTPNVARMVRQIEDFAGTDDSLRYPALLGRLAGLYRDAIPHFVRKNFNHKVDFGGPRELALVAKHGMLGNLAKSVERSISDPRLRMLFSFQTMYLGLSPYDAPAVYGVLTYMEYGEGIWYPKGGMVQICRRIAELAEKKGAEIRLNQPVGGIVGDEVYLVSGEVIKADAVLVNADLPYAERELLGLKGGERRRYSCSATMLYMDYLGDIDELLHHNVFFGADYRGNLDALFHAPRRVPEDPAFYACVSSKTDPARSAAGHSNLYVLIPSPNLDRPVTGPETAGMREHVFRRLAEVSSFDRTKISAEYAFGAEGWADLLNLDRGAAFGLSHDLFQSAFFRPSNTCHSNPHVTFVGASTIPGNGLPMVLISAELAEKRLEERGLL